MKSRYFFKTLAVAVTAIAFVGESQTPAPSRRIAPRISNNSTSPAIAPYGLIGYLASPRGRALLRNSGHPMLKGLAHRLGEPVSDTIHEAPSAIPQLSAAPAPDAVT